MVDMSLHGEHVTGAAKRAADRAHGPCRDVPPLFSTVSAEVQGEVVGKARAARRPTGTEHGKDKGGHVLPFEDKCGLGHRVLLAV